MEIFPGMRDWSWKRGGEAVGRALVFMLFFFYFLGFYFLGLGLGSDWEVEGEIWGNGRTEGLGSHPSGISAGGRNQGMLGWKGAGMSFSEGGKKGFFSFNSSSWEVCGASGSASLFLDFPLSQSPGCS